MMTDFRLNEPRHVGDIGEIDHERGSSQLLDVIGFGNFETIVCFDSSNAPNSEGRLWRQYSQVGLKTHGRKAEDSLKNGTGKHWKISKSLS